MPQIFEKSFDCELPYYICTYHPGKTLIDFKRKNYQFSREEGVYFINSLIDTLEYLHLKRRTHCDLHAQNILISKNVFSEGILLIDFGSGHRASDSSPSTYERGFPAFKNEVGQSRLREKYLEKELRKILKSQISRHWEMIWRF